MGGIAAGRDGSGGFCVPVIFDMRDSLWHTTHPFVTFSCDRPLYGNLMPGGLEFAS